MPPAQSCLQHLRGWGRARSATRSVNNSETHVARQRAAGSRNHHRASGRAARDNGCHVRIADDSKLRSLDAVERNRGRTGQPLAKNLRSLPDLGPWHHESDEPPKARVEAVDRRASRSIELAAGVLNKGTRIAAVLAAIVYSGEDASFADAVDGAVAAIAAAFDQGPVQVPI